MTGFRIFMLLTVLLIPALMIGFGLRFRKTPPERISDLFGYRTKRSMQNRDTWETAHRHFGRLWFRWGLVLLPVSAAAMALLAGKDTETVGWGGLAITAVQLIPMLLPVFLTERELKRTFDGYGRRKEKTGGQGQ